MIRIITVGPCKPEKKGKKEPPKPPKQKPPEILKPNVPPLDPDNPNPKPKPSAPPIGSAKYVNKLKL